MSKRRETYAGRKLIAAVRAMWPTGPCHLCARPIDPALVYPDPGSWTADHVVAVVDGGRDEWDNLRPAHLGCNSSAGATLGNRRRGHRSPLGARSRQW